MDVLIVIQRIQVYFVISFISLLSNVINPMLPVGRDKVVFRKIVYIFDESKVFPSSLIN